jgi:hypothetical protein
VHQRTDGDDRPGGQVGAVEDGGAGRHVRAAFDRAAEQRGVWRHEDVIADDHRTSRVTDRGRPQHRVLGDDAGRTDLDVGALGVEHRAVHDPGPRADPDVADERRARRHPSGLVDRGLGASMSDQHGLRMHPEPPKVGPGGNT